MTDAVIRGAAGDRSALRGARVAPAQTRRMSKLREDAGSQVPGRTYTEVTPRPIWRHEAHAQGVGARRLPYRVVSFPSEGSPVVSDTYSLQAKPRPGASQKILLTSDHQLMPMTPTNLQKVHETVGRVDGVFLAGDLVNIPDRASEWFDDARGRAFFPALQGRASQVLDRGGAQTTYRGAPIIQNAPLYTSVGNHEVMGRFGRLPGLNAEFSDPWPREVAEAACATRPPAQRAQCVKDASFNTDTYEELFTLPESREGGERYWAETIGDIRLVSVYATNIWRTPNRAVTTQRGKYLDGINTTEEERGHGQFIFEPIKRGSEQYAWLERELSSPESRRAKSAS
jgi:hypothetical protein